MAACTRRTTKRRPAWGLGVAVAVAGLAPAGCEDEVAVAAVVPSALLPDESSTEHVGQVRILAHDLTGTAAPSRLEVEARFASFAGMDTAFARTRANMITPAVDLLASGSCRSRADLAAIEGELAGDPLPPALRELTLLDAGELDLSFGGQTLSVPYALVPDLVAWMNGLEYRAVETGERLLSVDPTGQSPIILSWTGSSEADLPPRSAALSLPPAIRELQATLDERRLHVSWAQGPAFSWPILFVVSTAADPDYEVVCAVDDEGEAELSLAELSARGLDIDQAREGLQVTAIRTQRANLSAGSFDDIDVVLESHETVSVAPIASGDDAAR